MVLHRKSFQYQPASWWRSLYRVMALTALLHLDTNQFMLAVASLPAATGSFRYTMHFFAKIIIISRIVVPPEDEVATGDAERW
jgi:hypothetical protein